MSQAQEPSENIKNAFSCVATVFTETSYLLKGFEEAFAKHGFKKVSRGNAILTDYVSKNLNSPTCWLPRYVSLFFKPQNQKRSSPIASVTVCFYDLEPMAIAPQLVLGVAAGPTVNSWWFRSACFNRTNYAHTAQGSDQRIEGPLPVDGTITDFDCDKNKDGWPKSGSLFSVPLLDVNDQSKINNLVDKVYQLWQARQASLSQTQQKIANEENLMGDEEPEFIEEG
jgi:hypothetical protein